MIPFPRPNTYLGPKHRAWERINRPRPTRYLRHAIYSRHGIRAYIHYRYGNYTLSRDYW